MFRILLVALVATSAFAAQPAGYSFQMDSQLFPIARGGLAFGVWVAARRVAAQKLQSAFAGLSERKLIAPMKFKTSYPNKDEIKELFEPSPQNAAAEPILLLSSERLAALAKEIFPDVKDPMSEVEKRIAMRKLGALSEIKQKGNERKGKGELVAIYRKGLVKPLPNLFLEPQRAGEALQKLDPHGASAAIFLGGEAALGAVNFLRGKTTDELLDGARASEAAEPTAHAREAAATH